MSTLDDTMTNLRVCIDCGFYVCYGEVENPDPSWSAEACEAGMDGFERVTNGSDEDDCFSWRACDLCGSHLGGTRMHCVAW